jgi:hypothetical protein
MNASLKVSNLIKTSPTLAGMAAHSALYGALSRITYRQRLALVLGAKQRQRPAQVWA